MATTISTQDIVDAKRDIGDIGKAVNEKVIVSPRYGEDFKSLPMISAEFQISSDAAEAAAFSAAESANIAQSSANIAEAAATAATISAGVFETPEAGVDPVTGVADGAYFNVRSSSDESYVDEYQNIGGVPTPSGKSYPSGAALAGVSGAVDLVKTKISRDLVSVFDFFTGPEILSYSIAQASGSLQNIDTYRPLQEFADYISANDVGTAYWSGTFYTTSGILLGGASGCATKEVIGKLNIRAKEGSAGHTLFAMQCGQDFKWFGSINPMGLGGGIFNNRTWRRGLVLGGEHQCAHTYVNSAYAYGFSEYGVLLDNLTTSSDIADIRVSRCGSGYKLPSQAEIDNTWSDKSTFVKVSDNASTGTTQSSIISMTKMPLTDLRFNPILYINGELYNVINMNYATKEITIFPLLNTTVNNGVARYVYGAGVCTAGSDASTVRIGKLNATNCSVIYHSGALYPATIYGTQTGQSNFIDVLLGGNSVSQAHVGGAVISLYCEDSVFNIVRRTRAQLNYANLTNVALNLAKVYDLTRVRNPTTNELDKTSVGLEGVLIAQDGYWLSKENRGIAANDVKNIDVTDINRSEYWHYGKSKIFNILAPDMPRLELLGYNRKSCIVMGTNNAGNPTGDVVFNAPAGYTVNGQPSVTFNGFTQAAKFDVYLQFVRNNFIVTCTTLPPSSAPSASVTYDPPSIDANATIETTVTLTGVVVGDIVQAAFSRYNAGIEISAVVSAANTVTVKFKNTSASPIDLASGTLTVKLI